MVLDHDNFCKRGRVRTLMEWSADQEGDERPGGGEAGFINVKHFAATGNVKVCV